MTNYDTFSFGYFPLVEMMKPKLNAWLGGDVQVDFPFGFSRNQDIKIYEAIDLTSAYWWPLPTGRGPIGLLRH